MTRTGRPPPTPWGTRRRLQALMNRGWSPRTLQTATGLRGGLITAAVLASRKPVAALDDHYVAAVYDWAWQRPPPESTPRDRATAAAAREIAARNHWPPPMAWDDDTIDQPGAQPAPGWEPVPTKLRKSADLFEDLDWLRQQGGYKNATSDILAARLGMTTEAFDRARFRAARRQAQNELEAG